MGPPGSEGPRPDDDPAPGDPGEVTAPYTPPTASTSTGDAPQPSNAPVTRGMPPTELPPGVGWAPPSPVVQEIAPGLALSGTLPRFVAWWVDGLLLGLLGAIIGAILGSLGWSPVEPAPIDPYGPLDYDALFAADPVGTVLTVGLSALYFVGSWTSGRRATLGQRLLKLQVGNAFDGRSLSFDQAIRRWLGLGEFLVLLALIPGFGAAAGLWFLWAIVLLITTAISPTKQGLHDRIANSAVVRPLNAGNGLVVACAVIAIALAALALLSIVALIFLGAQVSDILSTVGESV